MKNQTNWIVGITDGNAHEYKIGNVTFTVLSEFEPKISGVTIKNRFERTITCDFTDLTGEIFRDKMAAEYVCSTAGKEGTYAVEKEKRTNRDNGALLPPVP